MGLRRENFGLSGCRGKRIVRKATAELAGETVKVEVRSKTQNTVRVGWNFTAKSESFEIKGFTNFLTADEAISRAFERWLEARRKQ